MAKVAALSFRVSDEVKAGLERIAASEDRSVSNLVERILRAWLTERGHLAGNETVPVAKRPRVGRAA